jgi:hypothetical protein
MSSQRSWRSEALDEQAPQPGILGPAERSARARAASTAQPLWIPRTTSNSPAASAPPELLEASRAGAQFVARLLRQPGGGSSASSLQQAFED